MPLPITQILTYNHPLSGARETTLSAVYRGKAIDSYLKELVRCLTEPLNLLPQIILHVELLVTIGSEQVHFNMSVKHATRNFRNVLDALEVLHQGLFHSNILLKHVEMFLEKGIKNGVQSDPAAKISEEEVRKLTQLKENLLDLNKFLDCVLLHYSSFGSKLPDIEKIKRASSTISKAINGLKPDRLKQLVPESLVTEEDVLCSALGLNDEFADRLRNLSARIRNHKTDLYFLTCFLKECYDSFDPEDLSDNAAKLQSMGFTENRSNVIAKWIAEQPLPRHRSLLAWAEIYLENLFKYDIFLNDHVSKFPYEENRLNEWFTQDVEREDCRFDRESGTISAINTTTIEEAKARIQEKITEFSEGNAEGQLYFHGTDHNSAKNILENGINLRKGKEKCDFSDLKGFYVTNDFEFASSYARKTHAAAVIIFNISDAYLQNPKCVNLSDPSNHDDWKAVIKFFRSGEETSKRPHDSLSQRIDECHCIMGPMADENGEVISQTDLIQICIKKKEMAREIGNPLQIVGAVFLNMTA